MSEMLGGGIGIGYAHLSVSVTLDPEGKSMMGFGMASLTITQYSQSGRGKPRESVVCLSGKDIDKLIPLLREAKRRLLEAGAA